MRLVLFDASLLLNTSSFLTNERKEQRERARQVGTLRIQFAYGCQSLVVPSMQFGGSTTGDLGGRGMGMNALTLSPVMEMISYAPVCCLSMLPFHKNKKYLSIPLFQPLLE